MRLFFIYAERVVFLCCTLMLIRCLHGLLEKKAADEAKSEVQEIRSVMPVDERVVKMNVAGTDEYQWELSLLFDNFEDMAVFASERGVEVEAE